MFWLGALGMYAGYRQVAVWFEVCTRNREVENCLVAQLLPGFWHQVWGESRVSAVE